MDCKLKRGLLTIEEKLTICKEVKEDVPKKILINKYRIGKSTINDNLRNENKFTKYVEEKVELGVSFAAKVTKRMRTGNFNKVGTGQCFTHVVKTAA